MKKFISKVKKSCQKFMTGKSGFSLVELIVVIAIMAVMAAVLAPALLGYVERSRAQKDDSATSEMTAAVQLALADFDVYDELLEHSVYDNASCYIDTDNESAHAANKVILKNAYGNHEEQYMFDDDARLLDEIDYWVAGNMRGLTITFSPDKGSNGDTYNLKDGVINKFVGRKTGYLHENPELYNRIRSVIGDTLETTSQTYRNSDYTLFIQLGTTGGAEAIAQDAIKVWGQFSGTNLHQNPNSFKFASGRIVGEDGQNDASHNDFNNVNSDNVSFAEKAKSNPSKIVPLNAEYTLTDGTVLEAGENFPTKPTVGDILTTEEYVYDYSHYGWHVQVRDKTKTHYDDLFESINGNKIYSLYGTFADCKNLVTAPDIPDSVYNLVGAFNGCESLKTAPKLPSGVSNIKNAFWNCYSLENPPELPESITVMSDAFYNCYSLKSAPKIPSGVTDLSGTFYGCKSLTEPPVIPNGVTNMKQTFIYCTKLSVAPIIPNSVTNLTDTFMGCNSLQKAPTIPNSVLYMGNTFRDCTKLSGIVEINATPSSYYNCFLYTEQSIELTGDSEILDELAATSTKGNVIVQ